VVYVDIWHLKSLECENWPLPRHPAGNEERTIHSFLNNIELPKTARLRTIKETIEREMSTIKTVHISIKLTILDGNNDLPSSAERANYAY
jgi:hypothetical protein